MLLESSSGTNFVWRTISRCFLPWESIWNQKNKQIIFITGRWKLIIIIIIIIIWWWWWYTFKARCPSRFLIALCAPRIASCFCCQFVTLAPCVGAAFVTFLSSVIVFKSCATTASVTSRFTFVNAFPPGPILRSRQIVRNVCESAWTF